MKADPETPSIRFYPNKEFETELYAELEGILAEENDLQIYFQQYAKTAPIGFIAKSVQEVLDRVLEYRVTAKTKLMLSRTKEEKVTPPPPTSKEALYDMPENVSQETDDEMPDFSSLEEALEMVDYESSSSEVSYSLIFKEEWKDLEFAGVLVELYDVFADVIRRVTLIGTDRIKVYMDTLQVPICIPLRDVSELNAETILEAIERVLQSAKEITFDETLEIIIGIVKMPVVGGKRLYTHMVDDGSDVYLKRSIISFTKSDDMCMARSILVGAAALTDPKKEQASGYPDTCVTENDKAAYKQAWSKIRGDETYRNLGERLLYFDTDSVIYIERKGEWSPATCPFLGDLKDEIPGDTIIEYAAAGPKNYAYNTRNGKSVCKVRRITLNHTNDKLINLQKMKDLLADQQLCVDVPKTKFIRDEKDFSIRTVESSKVTSSLTRRG
ncbi:hypothetical protein GQR58_015534 [Nymphon striatum]|nr:hypothetical protein GQR58_015534 [Nymphon striatum]